MKGLVPLTRTRDSGAREEGTLFFRERSEGSEGSESLKGAGLGLGGRRSSAQGPGQHGVGGVVRRQRRPAPGVRLPSSGES